MSTSSSTTPTPYAKGTRPDAGTTADVWTRARAYIHAVAMACKICPVRSADNCRNRCPARGAVALDRDLDDAAPPAQPSSPACRLPQPAATPPAPGRGRKPGDDYGDTIDSRTRRKALSEAVAAHGEIGATARMLPPGRSSAERSNDLAYLAAHGVLKTLGDGLPRRYRLAVVRVDAPTDPQLLAINSSLLTPPEPQP